MNAGTRLRNLSVIAAIGLTALSGVITGALSWRWGPEVETLQIAKRLGNVPQQIGNWKLVESGELAQSVVDLLQCAGYINRKYVNQGTGETVYVAVLLGPPGPISVHTPEICYSSRDYTVKERHPPATIKDSDGKNSEFWGMTFQSNRVSKELLRVHYAWSQDGQWTAASNPRFGFMGSPFLLKAQLATVLPSDAPADTDPVKKFLRDFVPTFKQHVFEHPHGLQTPFRESPTL